MKSNPYENCDDLENRPSSNKAVHPLKREYVDCLTAHGKSIDDLIRPSGPNELPVVDARRIRMKSFSVFEAEFNAALDRCQPRKFLMGTGPDQKLVKHCLDTATQTLF